MLFVHGSIWECVVALVGIGRRSLSTLVAHGRFLVVQQYFTGLTSPPNWITNGKSDGI